MTSSGSVNIAAASSCVLYVTFAILLCARAIPRFIHVICSLEHARNIVDKYCLNLTVITNLTELRKAVGGRFYYRPRYV